jgi:hypothetical protein
MQSLDAQMASMIKSADDGNIVRVSRNILSFLKEHSLVMSTKINPAFIGVHRLNRDGYGVNPIDVHSLLTDIADCGWCDEEVFAVCSDATEDCKDFNMKLMESSNGKLPLFPNTESIKNVSLSASHTNQALRCILAEMDHGDTRLCMNSKLNIAKVMSFDKGMADAACNGLTWLVIPASLLAKHDGLAQLLQSGLNTSGQIARPENELQVLRRLHSCWLQAYHTGGKVDFQLIRQKVMRSKPPCAAGIPHMFSFMLKASGGTSGEFLQDTEKYVKSTCTSAKSVGGLIFDCLSRDLKHTQSQMVLVRHAMLKLAYSDSLSAHEAKRLGQKDREAEFMLAESLLDEMRKVCHSFETSMEVFLARSRFEVSVACKLVGRPKPSLECLAHQLILEVRELTSANIPSRFEAVCKAELEDIKNKAAVAVPVKITPKASISLSNCIHDHHIWLFPSKCVICQRCEVVV